MALRADTFTVPVDFDIMRDCRKRAGYETIKQFRTEIKRRGHAFQYNEYANGSSTFRNDKAELIAQALGMAVTNVFPRYAEAKAAYARATAPIAAKEMKLYFTVPVDAGRLRACRERAGYPSASEFTRVLSNRAGYPLKYREYENPNSDRRHIKGSKAELIAEALGMAVTDVFPQYAEAKVCKEQFVDEYYYLPFTTIEERNNAILETMDKARAAALKWGLIYVDRLPWVFRIDRDEMISIGYETLVNMGDVAMHRGIKKDTNFEGAVCVAIKYAFSQICIASRAKMGSDDFAMFSLLDNDAWDEALPSDFNLEDQFIQREEVRRAIGMLSAEQRRDKHILGLLYECRLEAAYA